MSNDLPTKRKPWVNWALFGATVVVVFLIGMLTASIMERRAETIARVPSLTNVAEFEPRNEIWGQNFPKEYESYRQTLDTTTATKYGGSHTVDYLEQQPALVVMWAGYSFSKQYNQARGHGYAIRDIRNILRTGGEENSPQPATCWTCKSPDVPRMMAKMGPAEFYKKKWKELGGEIVNPIGCGDCHDPKTMNLRITRPALLEAMAKRGRNVSDFTHQEMRSLVCAQCHVEYYFTKPDQYLTFPWEKGFSADSMEAYYDEKGFYDWEHPLSKAKMLKAQHPDYELYMTGIHAARGVACADCHMPYKVEGGVKFSDHHIQSPLNTISNSCQTCHRQSEQELRRDVEYRQDKVTEIRKMCEEVISKAHLEAQIAWQNGATEDEMAPVLKLIRSAQWRWDWVAASNGVGFHAPVEVLRTLGTSLQKAEQARGWLNVVFTKHGVAIPVKLPNVSTKALAQKYIGLDMQKLIKDKEALINNIIPKWEAEATKRQGTLLKY